MMRRYLALSLLCYACLMLGGCSVDDAIARADRAAQTALDARAEVRAGIEKAEAVSAQLKALAATLESEKAAALIAEADQLVAIAKASLPKAEEFVEATANAVAVAKQARERGETWFNVLLAVAGVVVPGAGVAGKVISGLRTAVAVRNTAIKVTAAHADRMENAESDADLDKAKLIAVAEQTALGVKDVIASIRKG